jgi:transcriptional regulator with XRE-family HTH domain
MGDLIRAQRHKAKLSQEALAHGAGVNRSYYASLEAGRRNASIDTLARLASALGCDTADLVRGTQAVPGRKD